MEAPSVERFEAVPSCQSLLHETSSVLFKCSTAWFYLIAAAPGRSTVLMLVTCVMPCCLFEAEVDPVRFDISLW